MIILYSLLFLFYFVSLIVDSSWITTGTGILAIVAWIFSIKGSSLLFRVISILFVGIGVLVFFVEGRSITELPLYMTSMVPLLAIFYVLPFINSIIIVGRYDQQVSKLLKVRIHNMGQLFSRTSMVTFLLGGFLNLATLPLVKAVIQKNISHMAEDLRNKFISRAMLRGYVFSIIISPMELLVILTIESTHLPYLDVLPWLILFTFILIVLNWLIGYFSFKKFELTEGNQAIESKSAKKQMKQKVLSLVFYLVLFMIVILSVNHFLDMGFLQTIAFVIVPFSFLWAISIKRLKSYVTFAIPLWKKRTIGLKDNLVLFLGVGFFTSNLGDSSFIDYLQEPFTQLSQYPVFLFLFIQVLFLGLALSGFHPLVTLSILMAIVEPVLQLVNPLSLSLVMITSALSTTIAGPFNVSVSITGDLLHVNSYKVSLWNMGFAFLFSGVGTIMALCLL
ncbi:hypothetical protein RGU12_08590 [Fredinandcohnia sp. QZ13]|uniref:hypothetical protein n=1 Tax=Fredinandcohnia sp. QZ13 TaxID=3073144 RepID=UPI0028532AF8|nr:hypothetical protein [Fredinandcohnia sp. QZ13]MDR4887600.1 hypothetical protein [Fredinandcohnia sp. QZ13]